MSTQLEQKIQEYIAIKVTIDATNNFQVANLATVKLVGSDQTSIETRKEWMGTIDPSTWITAIRNQATARRTALKQEILDILNSGV